MASVSGRKISRSHTTVTYLAKDVVQLLSVSNLVTKVMLSVLNPKAGSPKKRLIIRRVKHGLELAIIESDGKQTLYVSAPNREAVIVFLVAWADSKGLQYLCRE
ncbi:MAG: hypothetical protein ABI747_04465 [Candidatus Moraniibacteriota bacterium]